MIDALLYAYRGAIWGSNLKFSADSCDIMDGGEPPARCGNVFVAIHQDDTKTGPDNDNCLQERFGFQLTLTFRAAGPPDRIGNSLISVQLKDKFGVNRRVEQLRALCHMNWGAIQDANNNLMAWALDNQGTVYGFCEPARYKGCSKPRLVGNEWFGSKPTQQEFGVVVDMTFVDARRFQPIAEYV